MKTSSYSAIFSTSILFFIIFVTASHAADKHRPLPGLAPDLIGDVTIQLRNPFKPPPNPWKPTEMKWPENYIEPTVSYGLDLVLPKNVRSGLVCDAGYNRFAGLPTLKADYFLPVRAWNDKTLFLTPRMSLEAKTESFSVGAGFRHLITSELMVGFHAFHDWERQRGRTTDFVKEAGVGFELSALPGKGADINLTMNAYFPTNELLSVSPDGGKLVKERLPMGLDAKLTCLLPPLVDWLDLKMEAGLHTYRGDRVNLNGHKATLTASTRDGMLSLSVGHESDTFVPEQIKVEGTVNLVFDWNNVLNFDNPFSAPYQMSTFRFERKIRDDLFKRVVRKHDLPTDRSEKRLALATMVSDRNVSFEGAFPDLPHARLAVQVSQSPWRDAGQVTTDESGSYSGSIDLPPGEYKFRLIHKATGRVTAVKTLRIAGGEDENVTDVQ
jgi:hypothetical protein